MTEQTYQTKTKGKKVNRRITFKSILLGVGAFFIVSMSLFHAPFDRFSKEYLEHYATYQGILDERDSIQNSLVNELGKSLTVEEYKKNRAESWALSKVKLKEYKKKKKELFKAHSFFGRGSFKFWLFVFGLVLLGFYFSIKSLIEDYRKEIRTGHEIISIIGIAVSLFWFYHLFFQTAQDFYTEVYLLFKVLICIAIAIFISQSIKYFTRKEGIIKTLIDLVLRIKVTHYRKMVVNALYAEQNDQSIDSIETVKDQADALDKDIRETMNKIVR